MLSDLILSIRSYSAVPVKYQEQMHQRYVSSSPFVLRRCLPFTILSTEDRDYTDSRRIEPNSRTTLIGEQPNPSHLLQREDVMSRHRGAKHRRQYELSSGISLFNYVITATFMFLSPCIATRFRLYLQPMFF